MKILHCCLSNFYIDGYDYQENELVRRHVREGHEVLVLASTETFNANKELDYVSTGDYMGKDGARVIRVSYSTLLPHKVMRKLRYYNGVSKILNDFKPDVILFHGMAAGELVTIAKYIKNNNSTKLYIDSHEDYHNSARNFVSKWFLHYGFYRPILKKALPYTEKILALSPEVVDLVNGLYEVPKENIELYPLGGEIFEDAQYNFIRNNARQLLNISANDILIVQSGKMDKTKKLIETLRAFNSNRDERLKLVIVGHIYDDILDEANIIINSDKRIHYVGWKSASELKEILCAADIYIQPGTQSATMQASLCCRCSVILHNYPSHRYLVNEDNGWLINNKSELEKVLMNLSNISNNKIETMKVNSLQVAKRWLDYNVLASRIYH